jgi:hypothetical protein
MNVDPTMLVVDALACYRATRLITRDSVPVFRVPRDAVVRRWEGRPVAELVTCPWCVSVWLAAGIVTARLLLPGPWTLLALVLAFSAVAGWLSERE